MCSAGHCGYLHGGCLDRLSPLIVLLQVPYFFDAFFFDAILPDLICVELSSSRDR